ncbi:acyltransferase [Flavobacterium sp.]|uniref:acyltransferase family protein n=1 Tax=Flavobacterium sp. TaxID=239 RepID=UPI00261C33C9|nr:acyltransferase [Flavobacterium sp.]
MRNILKIEFNPDRIYGLDVLRAAAIFFVLVPHGGFLLPQRLKMASYFFSLDGVSIFFVLSGFLLGGILIKNLEKATFTKTDLINFWVRRWFRTLPNYFLILTVLCIFSYYTDDGFALGNLAKYFVFSQNLFEPQPEGFFPEAWSLSVEEWFYLLIPVIIFLLIVFLKVKPKKAVLSTVILIIATITLFRYIRFENTIILNYGDWDMYYRKQVCTRLDSIMFGVLGSYFQFYYRQSWIRYKFQLLIAGMILLICSTHFFSRLFISYGGMYSCVFSFTVVSLAVLFLLPFLSELRTGKGWIYRGVTYTSLISYSMYLLNFSIIQRCIVNKIKWTLFLDSEYAICFVQYFLYWILVFVFSILLYKYFEMPMTRLRERINR